jgi:hypothetical protein
MRKALLSFLLALLTLAGCAAGARIPLDQIQTRRTIAAEKAVLMDRVRIYAMKEQFKISSLDEVTGRIHGSRDQTGVGREGMRALFMQVSIVPTTPAACEVTVHFIFSGIPTPVDRNEESILVECYTAIFEALEAKAK